MKRYFLSQKQNLGCVSVRAGCSNALTHTKGWGCMPPTAGLGVGAIFWSRQSQGTDQVVSKCRGRTDNQQAFKRGLHENERGQLGAGLGETRVDRARFV